MSAMSIMVVTRHMWLLGTCGWVRSSIFILVQFNLIEIEIATCGCGYHIRQHSFRLFPPFGVVSSVSICLPATLCSITFVFSSILPVLMGLCLLKYTNTFWEGAKIYANFHFVIFTQMLLIIQHRFKDLAHPNSCRLWNILQLNCDVQIFIPLLQKF